VDYGVGNLAGCVAAFTRIGVKSIVTNEKSDILNSRAIILPGVGSFDAAAENLVSFGVRDVLLEFAESGKPVLGICLGMQLMLDRSEEGKLAGLGFVQGETVKLSSAESAKVPHMGLERVTPSEEFEKTLPTISDKFYFMHSYFCKVYDEGVSVAYSNHGENRFVSAFKKNNVVGVQFHPEKSGDVGDRFLKGFVGLV